MSVTSFPSPIGVISVESEGNTIYRVVFGELEGKNEDRKIKEWFSSYFRGENPPIPFELKPKARSEFQARVLKLLSNIPYGEVVTYGAIARKISPTMSAQAVGGAVGHNPIPILIPCHRVVGKGKNLTGFTGGIDKKIALLKVEGVDIKEYRLPKEKV